MCRWQWVRLHAWDLRGKVSACYSSDPAVWDWTSITLLVNGERFHLGRGTLLDSRRELNLRKSELRRPVLWQSALGIQARITAEHLGVVRYSADGQNTPDQQPVDTLLHVSIEGAQRNDDVMHWEMVDQGHDREPTWLLSETRASNVQLAQAMSFNLSTPGCAQTCCQELLDSDLAPGIHSSGMLAPGATLTTEKVVVTRISRDGVEGVVRTGLDRRRWMRSVAIM